MCVYVMGGKIYGYFNLGGVRRRGELIRSNTYTLWFKVMKGAKTFFYIKRHIIKHNVKNYYLLSSILKEH